MAPDARAGADQRRRRGLRPAVSVRIRPADEGRLARSAARALRRAGLTAACAALLAAGCGGGADGGRGDRAGGTRSTPTPEVPRVLPGGGAARADAGRSLVVGITEANPAFVWASGHPVAGPFARWRDELGRVRPELYRLVLDWAALQPDARRPPDLAAASPGCLRTVGPCAAWQGVREQLAALASRQRQGGWEGVAVVTGTPEWAASRRAGCERLGTQPRSRAPRADALPAYGRFVAAVLRAAREEGAELRWWSAWNEPNHHVTLSPQRVRCRASSRSPAPAVYAGLARALRRALDAAPGVQGLVLGDLAGALRPQLGETTVPAFLRALPRDVVCGATVYGQHAYVGSPDPVRAARRALAARKCGFEHVIWITQTGARVAAASDAARLAACRALHRRLVAWYRDPQVTAAFQYTVRDDNTFPMGLVSIGLDRALPPLAEWRAWGGDARPDPRDAPPPQSCA